MATNTRASVGSSSVSTAPRIRGGPPLGGADGEGDGLEVVAVFAIAPPVHRHRLPGPDSAAAARPGMA